MKYIDSLYEYDITSYSHKSLFINNLFKFYIFVTPCDNFMLKIAISREYVYNELQLQVNEIPFDVFEVIQCNTPIDSLDNIYIQYKQLITEFVISVNKLHSSLLTQYHLTIDNELKELEREIIKDKYQESKYYNRCIEHYVKVKWDNNKWSLEDNVTDNIMEFNHYKTAKSVMRYICNFYIRIVTSLKNIKDK